MSDFRALGGVSSTLRTLLLDRMELPDGIVTVPITVGPPPFTSKDTDPHKEDPRLSLFLYRVTENGYLQNQEIPGHGAPGAYGHPPLSLNLHYLVTATGNAELRDGAGLLYDDTTAQLLLGSAMRVFHDVPLVTDSLMTTRPPSGALVLHESLRDQFEQVKLTLEPLTLEDITKVWTALALRFRLSAGYVVNVVQIESRRPRTFPRPVGKPVSATVPPLPSAPPTPGPMVYVLTIQTPAITDVRVMRAGTTKEIPFAYAAIGDDLVLRGTSLSGPVTTVAFGDVVVPAKSAEPTVVVATIPDATIAGAGAIPPELQLQPGVRAARVVVRDPLVPGRAFASNDAAFMLVPSVNPALLAYAVGPRRLTIQGTRLIGSSAGGETLIGRAVVSRDAYLSESPTQIVVPIPDTLPTRGVQALVGSALPDPIPLGAGAQTFSLSIGGVSHNVTANLPASIARSTIASILAALIHDAAPTEPAFINTRVDLWHDRLLIVPGGLTDAVTVAPVGGSTLAADLGLTAAQPAGVGNALISGELGSPPPLSSPVRQLRFTIGAQPPLTLVVPNATSLVALADALQTTINAAPQPEYANALVATSGSQLLILPGTGAVVAVDAAPGDDSTATELQLHAQFMIRVRVNGAESIDSAVVELPR